MQLKDINLTKEQAIEQTKKYMIETYERFPFVAVRAKDMYLYDENGTGYLDFYGGIAVNSAGSCNEKVVAAVREQVGDIMHTFNYPYTVPQTALAKLICETIGMDKIFFQNSGTESNEAMIKMARKYGVDNYGEKRYHIVTAKDGFHGRTYGALSATGQPDNACQKGFKPMLPGFTYADYNDLESFRAAVTEDTIAIMLEPIQGEGGVVPGTEAFFKGIRKLCDEKGLLLLIDEIQTGWFRTGPAMAYMRFGIKPDAVSMAKAMGGGMPIGAVCATAKMATAFNPGSHGTTYGGNPVCCAAALAQINDMIERKLGDNAAKVGAYFMEELRKLPHVKEVRGEGLLVGVVFDIPRALDIKHGCLDGKLLVTAIGANVVRMVPPLIATKEDCDKAVGIIKAAVEAL
ncbi:MAG: acetylornithine/succinylornithine family transaminase [Clostridiales Family XIII bacterium]|nr:acetylornithine/succinylornithine family transaminase [Clostridiales Family XIII bacterium]